MDKGIIKKGATDRTVLIETVIGIIENKLGSAQNELFRAVIDSVFDGMDRDGDRIKNTLKNRRLLVLVDNVFTDFAKGKGLEVGATVISGVTKVINYNEKYFSLFTKPAELAPLQETTINTLSDWLGITDKGLLKPNGYLDTLINDQRIRNQVKDITLKTVVNQSGFFDTKKVLRQYLTDTEENGGAGALRKYYRNFVYDTISTVDRTASKLTADKLKLNYAIYEGGLIKTSRKFCITHNGKVYSREEIADFDPKEAKPPGYNPFTDLGGYACRHHLNWIPDAVAFSMRPELRLKPVPKKPEASAEKPPVKKVEEATSQPANIPFEEIKPLKRREFTIKSKRFDSDSALLEKHAARAAEISKEQSDLFSAYNAEGKAYQKKAAKVSEEERQQLLTGLREAYQKYIDKAKEATAHQATAKEIRARMNDEIKAVLLKDRPKNNFDVNIKSATLKGDRGFMKNVPEAVDFFRTASQKYLPEDFVMNVNGIRSDGRAHYYNGEVYLSKTDAAKVIVHEFGHHLETHNQVFKEAVNFLNKRTEGNPVRKLRELNKAYKSHEIFRDGGFPTEYVGKIYAGTRYGGRSYTEIISMGLEYMFNDPATFMKKDKDYFDFIYTLFF